MTYKVSIIFDHGRGEAGEEQEGIEEGAETGKEDCKLKVLKRPA